jgi:hypothetical protein
MSAIVDYQFYTDTYMGTEADEASFLALCARALDVVGAMTRWAVTEENFDNLPAPTQTLYQKAVCAQVDFFAVNGLDSVSISAGTDNGFTVGKVSVHGKSGAEISGRLSASIAPMAVGYLEQTGLLNPSVAVSDWPMLGGWFGC